MSGYIIDTNEQNILNIINIINNKIIANVDLNILFENFQKQYDIKGFSDFADLNKKINNGDCIKDGTNDKTLEQLGLFDIFSLSDVKNLAHSVIDKAKEKGYAIPQVFLREKKGDPSIKMRYIGTNYDIGHDSGLGPENYLDTNNFFVYTNFGKYIDPFKINSTKNFPPNNQSLQINETTFDKLGYDDCMIYSKAKSLDKYEYNIKIMNKILTNKGDVDKKNDDNIQTYFIGNKKKKIAIKSSNSTDDKIAMIIGKSWGDKLQVFIMWIKMLIDKQNKHNHITAMSTCDEIVTLFSIILGLPCFYVETGVNKENLKINNVLYYDISQMSTEKAIDRLNTEKKIVLAGYSDAIKLIRNFNENTDIYIKEIDDKPFYFKQEFFDAILKDMNIIINNVKDITNNANDSVDKINSNIDFIKKCKLNEVFKKGNNGLIYMIRSKAKYNENTQNNSKANIANAIGIDENKVRSATFFYIATTYFTRNNSNMIGGNNKIDETMLDIFDMTPINVYVKDQLYDQNVEDDTIFDANLSFYEEIKDLYNNHKYKNYFHFISLYSEILYRLSINPDYTTDNLIKLVNTIFEDFQKYENANKNLNIEVNNIYKSAKKISNLWRKYNSTKKAPIIVQNLKNSMTTPSPQKNVIRNMSISPLQKNTKRKRESSNKETSSKNKTNKTHKRMRESSNKEGSSKNKTNKRKRESSNKEYSYKNKTVKMIKLANNSPVGVAEVF